ncbi:cytochrome P450 family protein [Myceligenerans indicum]|uniref:Cytochrome P450 n=1 Tax=Myceligenerans indicum TaxID=2593663 RepID=A0ABS1LQR7_9MICO|nr:cytochrome P450 [Myceligenerans indicum]MBL0888540.1 cytochrome P450 [Myceligenerans indicum]
MNSYVLDPAGTDIQGEIRALREHGPITPVELPGGVSAWAVTDAALLKRLVTERNVSKDASRHWGALAAGEVPDGWPLSPWVLSENMFTAYGTDHRRLRRLVAPTFTARRTTAMRPRIEEITSATLDRVAEAGAAGPVDLRETFAFPIPIEVISELIGVPEHLGPGLRRCADLIFDTTITPDEMRANIMDMHRILGELIAHRREHPGDDITSALIAARDDEADAAPTGSGALTEEELLYTVRLFINAGHETTVNLLDQTIFSLLTHPQILDRVLAGEISWEAVIEESLRHEAPAASIPLRYAVTDLEAGGVTIKQGEAILAMFAAAGRDPQVHDDPDTFDPARAHTEHLAFGHGVHHCVGAPLARLEAAVALPALFERFPGMKPAEPPETFGSVRGFVANGHARLPVHLA